MKKGALGLVLILFSVMIYAQDIEEYDKYIKYEKLIMKNSAVKYGEFINKGKIIGYLLKSDEMKTTKEGMMGPVPVILIVDEKLGIIEIIIDKNQETSDRIATIKRSRFLSNLKKYKYGSKEEIDGFAGATLTSNAVKYGVYDTINKFYTKVIKK